MSIYYLNENKFCIQICFVLSEEVQLCLVVGQWHWSQGEISRSNDAYILEKKAHFQRLLWFTRDSFRETHYKTNLSSYIFIRIFNEQGIHRPFVPMMEIFSEILSVLSKLNWS